LKLDEQDPQPFDIDLSRLLADPDATRTRPRRNLQARNDPPYSESLDDWLLREATPAFEARIPLALEHAIHNTDRTVGARLAGEIARRYGDAGLPPCSIVVRLQGSAGQSFGAFCINGLHLILVGEANDYVGKGMAGGEIIVRPPPTARWATNTNFILGNTVLYGATGGVLFAAGRAGERFAVRNSGAVAVVEGVGDHGCEYMTGGTVVVLGKTGRNFGAGMTGGLAFVLDVDSTLPPRLNEELVRQERITQNSDETRVRELVQRHLDATESAWAHAILADWQTSLASFWKVVPKAPA
jgi:glutamate synthase domain-containing protein 3